MDDLFRWLAGPALHFTRGTELVYSAFLVLGGIVMGALLMRGRNRS